MNSLDDAWNWYLDAKKTLSRMRRVGERYWDVIPWSDPPWKSDNQLFPLQRTDVTEPAINALNHLDDLAIVVLFSVFEALVRSKILDQIEQRTTHSTHPVIDKAIEFAKERISEGSFFHVLDAYKGTNNDLIEEVNQVRKYRNGVAHGRRNLQPPTVSPDAAYQRLQQFLDLFFAEFVTDDAWVETLRNSGD